jgi:hypothetical protein
MKFVTRFGGLARAAAVLSLAGLVVTACQSDDAGKDPGSELGVSQSAIVTELSGYEYAADCLLKGVPIPPPFNYEACKATPQGADCGAGWVYTGAMEAFSGGDADVFYYATGPATAEQPEGLCVAFPRFIGGATDNLLGVICQGKVASKACFWDSPETGFTSSTTTCYLEEQASTISCSAAKGGAELEDEADQVGLSQCSDCHAGENAFIVHPNEPALKSVPWIVSDNWVEPVVKESWPQNQGPGMYFLSAAADTSCGACHGRTSRLRFPELSEDNKDFCFRLLGYENGRGAEWHTGLATNVVGRTMPPDDPQSAGDPTAIETYNALVAACEMPERYGRLARSLFHHGAGRGATPEEAVQLRGLPLSFAEAQDDIVRPSLSKLLSTDSAVVIDGTPESPLWAARSIPRVVNYKLSGTVSYQNDVRATFRGMWNDQYLYVFVTVFDDQRQTSGSPAWEDDSVELYIDGHRNGGSSYDANDFQFVFRPGDTTVHVGGGRTNMSTAGVLHASYDALDFYNIEVAIPWTTLGVSPGRQLGMEVHVNDDDDGGVRDAQVSWRTTATDSWTVPSNFTAVDVPTPLLFAAAAVTVNGQVDGTEWDLSVAEPLTRQAIPVPLSNNTAVWQSRWDAENLYLFVRVQDESVLSPDSAKPYHDDSVEISIDANNGHAGAIDFYDDFQLIFRAGESGIARLGDESTPMDLATVQSAVTRTTTGYDLEVGIPWSSLKTAPGPRATIGLEVQVNDDDTGAGTFNNQREGKIAYCSDRNMSYLDTRFYCVKKLLSGPEVTTLPRIARNAKAHDPNVPGVLVFDGSGSDSAWGGSGQSIDNTILGSPSAFGLWRGAWNEEYLYFHFVVADPGTAQSNSGSAWYLDDSVELLIDPSNNRGSTYDTFDLQYMFKPGSAFLNQTQIGPNSKGFLGRTLSTEGIKVASQAAAGVYQIEVAIPWATLHVAPEPELHMGLEVQLNDDDAATGAGRDGKLAWFGSPAMGDVAYQRPDAFGTVQLGY